MKTTYYSFDELPVMLNAHDVSMILGVSRAFAYNLFHATGFPVIVIGKRRLVKKESFMKWLEGQQDS